MLIKIARNAPVKKYEKKWQFCIGSCHAATLLRTDTLKILKRIHDELGIIFHRYWGSQSVNILLSTTFIKLAFSTIIFSLLA